MLHVVAIATGDGRNIIIALQNFLVNQSQCNNLWYPQLSNLRWMPISDRIGFGPAMKMGSSRRFLRYPTTYMWVSSWLPFTMDEGLSWFILIHSKGMPTWNSHIGCGVSLELSWWAHFHGRVKTYADWVWYLSKIGELCSVSNVKASE